jgi:hypothetical protein
MRVREDAFIRAAPTRRSEELGVLLGGTRVHVESCTRGWCLVEAGRKRGYVWRPLLTTPDFPSPSWDNTHGTAEPHRPALSPFSRFADRAHAWTMRLVPIVALLLYCLILLAPARPISPRDHLVLFVILLVIPGIFAATLLFGMRAVTQSTLFQAATAITNILDILFLVALLARTPGNPMAGVLAIFFLAGIVGIEQGLGPVGALCFSLAAEALGIWELFRDAAEESWQRTISR